MAVHLYTASRVTTDVDAEFGGRVYLPNDLMVEVTLEDGTQQVVYFDTNYNSTFALMHEDYLDDSIPVDLGMDQIRVHVLSSVDLAVSKIARFADNDKDDIAALVRLGLTSADEIEHRATSALAGYDWWSGDAETEPAGCRRLGSRGRKRTGGRAVIDRTASSRKACGSGIHLLAARHRGHEGAWRWWHELG